MVPQSDETLTRIAYDTVADVYADHFPSTEPEQPLELAMLDHFCRLLPEPRRVLDAGCGAGRMLPYVRARGCRPEGVDLSPEMIRRATQDHPEFPVTLGSLTNLPFDDQSFDGAFAWYSTIHNRDGDLPSMVGELLRVTRSRGYLLFAFQSGTGKRQVGKGFADLGHPVEMYRYHRTVEQMMEVTTAAHCQVVAHLVREPMGIEADPQAVLLVRTPPGPSS